jgi:hypothetical protein
MKSYSVIIWITGAVAQQVYIPAEGPSSRTACSANNTYATALPSYSFRAFSFTQTETVRTATSRPAPSTTTSFAPPYASLSSLVPDLSTAQWGNWDPSSTATATDSGNPYGNASWSAIWDAVPWVNFYERDLLHDSSANTRPKQRASPSSPRSLRSSKLLLFPCRLHARCSGVRGPDRRCGCR